MKETRITGSEAVIRCLLAEGVDLVYGYPGGAIMPVYDELYKFQKELKHILVRHEQGAVHAAQGFARATGKVGVVIATSGPGATNIVTGIADAQIDSTPLVCITGQVGKLLLGSDAFQEIDIVGVSTPVTKWNIQVTEAADIPKALAKAFYIARSGRPGPVLVDITKNAQFDMMDFKYEKCVEIRSYVPKPTLNIDKVKEAAEIINAAKKPYIIFGQGIILAKAETELKELIEKSGIPSASTLLGLSALPSDHPLHNGMVGMHGNYATNLLTNECDVLIALGMRFDDRVTGDLKTYAKQAKVIHFDIDPAEIDKNVKTTVAVLADIKESLSAIIPLIEKKTHTAWQNQFREKYQIEFDTIIKKELYPTEGGIYMGEAINVINKHTKGDAIIVSDVGQHQMFTCRYAKYNNTKSNITSGGLGTMGFALPAAIGAKTGMPDKDVIAIIGDGGFQMTIQELGTVFQTKIPLKIVVLNNGFLGMVRQWQQMFFDKRYASTEMINPNFVAIAEGFYIKAKKISKREELDTAIAEMMACDEAYFLEIEVEKETNVFPMVTAGASVSDVRLC